MTWLPFFSTVVLRLLTCVTLAATWAVAGPAHAETPPPSDAELAATRCIAGLERFLPGDYFYCLASQSYGLHEFDDARRLYRKAARWGSKPAEFVLGIMALYGDHEPVDRPLALAWLSLAAERHTPRFERPYRELESALSPAERQAAAVDLARLGPRYRDAIAMPRAEQRYRDGMRALHEHRMAQTTCLEGMSDLSDLAGGSGDASPAMAQSLAAHCPSPAALEDAVNQVAGNVFEDWGGHVSIGPLEPMHAAGNTPARPH